MRAEIRDERPPQYSDHTCCLAYPSTLWSLIHIYSDCSGSFRLLLDNKSADLVQVLQFSHKDSKDHAMLRSVLRLEAVP